VLPKPFLKYGPRRRRQVRAKKIIDNVERSQRGKEEIEKKMIA
jgi:hypothetical protein